MATTVYLNPVYQRERRNGRSVPEALAAVRAARRLRQTLEEIVAENNRRSRAAKKGWKTRRG